MKDNRTISVQAQDDKSGINRIYIEEEDNDFSAGNEKNEYTFALDDKIIQEIKNKNIEILKRKIVLEDKAGNKEEKELIYCLILRLQKYVLWSVKMGMERYLAKDLNQTRYIIQQQTVH